MEKTKNYIKWFYKEVETKFGSVYNLSINLSELNSLTPDKYWNVKLTMMKRREPSQYWDTHYVIEDTFTK